MRKIPKFVTLVLIALVIGISGCGGGGGGTGPSIIPDPPKENNAGLSSLTIFLDGDLHDDFDVSVSADYTTYLPTRENLDLQIILVPQVSGVRIHLGNDDVNPEKIKVWTELPDPYIGSLTGNWAPGSSSYIWFRVTAPDNVTVKYYKVTMLHEADR